MAEEAIVNTCHETPPDENHDADIVEFIANACHPGRVVRDGVVSGGHAQTGHGAEEETRKGGHICAGGRVISACERLIHDPGCEQEQSSAAEMRPDVDRLVVQIHQACEATSEGIGRSSVAGVDVLVVALPCGQIIPEDEQGVFELLLERRGGVEKG